MSNDLTALIEKYKGGGAHLLLPSTTEVQINPYYKFSVMEVKADVSDNSGDIFSVGKTNTAKYGEQDNWVEYFSPAKPLLMKISTAAGIQFDPERTGIDVISKNIYKAKAGGAIRLPDGTWKVHYDEKLINLDDEEDKFRIEFMDKSIKGITGTPGYEAAKLFKGQWIEIENKKREKQKAYVIDDQDRQKYIDRAVMINMMLLRKNAPQKALTGAILRVVRALIGMKGQYTKEELKKPFVVARVSFSPDYSDPEVRRAMLEHGLASMNNVFSNTRPAISGGNRPFDVTEEFSAADYVDNEAFKSDQVDREDEPNDNPPDSDPDYDSDAPPPWMQGETVITCGGCDRIIEPEGNWTVNQIAEYSQKNFKKILCPACQKEEKKNKGGVK